MSYIFSKNKLYELQDLELFINSRSKKREVLNIFYQSILSNANNDKKKAYFNKNIIRK